MSADDGIGHQITFTLNVELTLNLGHLMSQPKFNQISMYYDVVCLLGLLF